MGVFSGGPECQAGEYFIGIFLGNFRAQPSRVPLSWEVLNGVGVDGLQCISLFCVSPFFSSSFLLLLFNYLFCFSACLPVCLSSVSSSFFYRIFFVFRRLRRIYLFLHISRQLLSIVPQSSATGKTAKNCKKRNFAPTPSTPTPSETCRPSRPEHSYGHPCPLCVFPSCRGCGGAAEIKNLPFKGFPVLWPQKQKTERKDKFGAPRRKTIFGNKCLQELVESVH